MTLSNVALTNVEKHATWSHFGSISNELGTPKVLRCRGNLAKRHSMSLDWSTSPTVGFFGPEGLATMRSVNHRQDRIDYDRAVGYDISISYFLSLNVDETIPAGVMAGDANINWVGASSNLQINPAMAGVQRLDLTNEFAALRFVSGRDHPQFYQHHGAAGNIAFTDGSVSQVNNRQLRRAVFDSTNALKRTDMWLVIPK